MVFYKKVDATQLKLTEQEVADLKAGKPVHFLNLPVRPYGASYLTILLAGETQVRVVEDQWVIRHPEGTYEVIWPDQFAANFIKPPEKETAIPLTQDPFLKKSYNQPSVII